jgi:hypothetical protein
MNTHKHHLLRSILLATILLLPSCDYKHDTVSFEAVGQIPVAETPMPKIYIDTNISIGSMMGGTVKSNKPYDIQAHYRDDTFTFATAEFTMVTVTYADGTNDPGAAALKLPLRFQGREHESYNSMAGGAVVVTKSRIIQAEFPGTITRDEPFTLQIQGRFTKEDGSTIPFNIKQEYDVVRDKRTQTWAEFMSDC